MQWIQTYKRRSFRLDGPDHREVDIEDIAWALSHLCRFNGHTAEFYSVAQHSVFVSEIVEGLVAATGFTSSEQVEPRMVILAALLHDAHEAYVGDVTRPLKPLLGHDWENVERDAEGAVVSAFSLPGRPSELEIVRRADAIACATEARDLLPGGPIGDWTRSMPAPHGVQILAMPPRVARAAFLARFEELMGIVG